MPSRAREVEAGTEPRGSAEHDVTLAGTVIPAGIGDRSADDEVGEAVAVDVPGPGDRGAAEVVAIDAVEAEAVGAVEGREVEAGAEPRGSAEHDVSSRRPKPARVSAESTDDDVGEAVAVDVTGPGDGATAVIACVDAVEPEAVGAVEVGERGGRRVTTGGGTIDGGSIPLVSTPVWTSSSAAPTVKVAKSTPPTVVRAFGRARQAAAHGVAVVAEHRQLVRGVVEVQDLEHVERERVAVAAEVDALDRPGCACPGWRRDRG